MLAERRHANSRIDISSDEKLERSLEKRLFDQIMELTEEFPGQALRKRDGREGARMRWLWAWNETGKEEPCMAKMKQPELHDAERERRINSAARWLKGKGFKTISLPLTDDAVSPDIIAWRWTPTTACAAVQNLVSAAREIRFEIAAAKVFAALNPHNLPRAYARSLQSCGWACLTYTIAESIGQGTRAMLEVLNAQRKSRISLVRVGGEEKGMVAEGTSCNISWHELATLTETSVVLKDVIECPGPGPGAGNTA